MQVHDPEDVVDQAMSIDFCFKVLIETIYIDYVHANLLYLMTS